MRISRKQLLEKVQKVWSGVAKKELIEQGMSCCFQDGKLFTFNEEIACSVPSGLPRELHAAVPAKSLLHFLEHLPDEELVLKCHESEWLLLGEKKKTVLRVDFRITMDPSLLPEPGRACELAEGFSEAMKVVCACASKESQAPYRYRCLHVTPKFLEACSRFQMCRWNFPEGTGLKQRVLLQASAAKQVAQQKPQLAALSQGWIHFSNDDHLSISCRTNQEDYPNLDAYYQADGQALCLPKVLQEVIKRAQHFSSQDPDENLLSLCLRVGELELSGSGQTGSYQEHLEIDYQGPPLQAWVAPEVLLAAVKKSSECLLTEKSLLVHGEDWIYVAYLVRELKGK